MTSELTFKGMNVQRIAIYRTWHDTAQDAADASGLYGKHSIAQDSMTGLLDRIELAEAVMEASGAASEYAIAIQTADHAWHDYNDKDIE